MRNLFVRQYDAFGDWVSINGLIRHVMDQRHYEKVYLVLEYNDGRKNFLELLYGDEPKIHTVMDRQLDQACTIKDDIIDLRYNESHARSVSLNYWCKQNKFGDYKHSGKASNSDNFYIHLGIDPKVKNERFFFSRRHDLEEELFSSLNLDEPYSVICEYGENLIDRKYVKHSKVVNLHRISPNLVDILKILENSDDIHLIENTLGLFVYHMQSANLLDKFKVNLHAYARKESHRRCDSPDCDNKFLNMLLLPKLDNWEIIWK